MSRLGALWVLAMIAPRAASAQTAPDDGWALDRFEPSPAGDVFFLSDHPWYSSTRVLAAGLALDHAVNPLVFRSAAPGGSGTTEAIAGMLTGHLGAMVSFADRVGLGLSLPVAVLQSGTTVTDGGVTLGAAQGVAPGDLRVTARVRLFGRSDEDGLSLHLGAHLWAPLGARVTNTGDDGLRVEPRVILAGRGGPVRWSATVGYHVRPEHVASQIALSHELRATAAVGVVALDDRLTVGPEAYVFSSLSDPSGQGSGVFGDRRWGAEALVGAHFLAADTVLVGLGGGVGIGEGSGVAAGRAMLSVAYAPVRRSEPVLLRPLDSDGDDVGDPDDRCPTTPRGDNPDPARPGCPAADADGDGVLDDADRCVNEPQGARPDPGSVGCPLRDRDSDGFFDGEDACPEQAQGPTPDLRRRGCPAADRDRDGVLDHDDQCPDAPPGLFLDTGRAGCPLPDGDRDLVPDPSDACPRQPGVPSTEASRNGCPHERVELTAGEIRIRGQLVFRNNRDRVRPENFPALEAVADVMRGAGFIRRLSIEGHTSEAATPERNQSLSERRARAVMRWLIEHRVAAERLEARGFGQTRPVSPDDAPEGRARNRRVEFRVTDPALSSGASATPAAATPAVTPATTPRDDGRHRRRGGRRQRR